MIGAGLEGADLESRVAADVTHGGHLKITQYIYQQMPEQSGGGCSGI
jgi:hypothetical protein